MILIRKRIPVLGAMSARADLDYTVTMNTPPPLLGCGECYWLDFQLIGSNNNNVILQNFNFGSGGAADSTTDFYQGGATGDAGSSVTLNGNGYFLTEFSEEFTPGDSLSFHVDVSSINTGSSGFPDMFSFAILDSNGYELPTPGPYEDFFDITFDSTTNPTVATYGSDSYNLGAPTVSGPVSTTPEPAVIWQLGGMGLLLAGLGAARKVHTL